MPFAQYELADESHIILSDDSAVIAETMPFRLAQQLVDIPGAEAELEPPPVPEPLAELEALLEQPQHAPPCLLARRSSSRWAFGAVAVLT